MFIDMTIDIFVEKSIGISFLQHIIPATDTHTLPKIHLVTNMSTLVNKVLLWFTAISLTLIRRTPTPIPTVSFHLTNIV